MKRSVSIRKAKSLAALIRWKNKQPKYLIEIQLEDGTKKEIIASEEETRRILKRGKLYVRPRTET